MHFVFWIDNTVALLAGVPRRLRRNSKGQNEWETGDKWGTEATGNRDVTVNRNGKEYICHLRESEGVAWCLKFCPYAFVCVFYPSLLQQ
jgi:hypothetical protein